MSKRKFRPALIPWIAVFLLTPLLAWLSHWQYERYVARSADEALIAVEPVSYQQWESIDLSQPASKFLWAEISGRYDPRRQFLIDNMVENGRSGFFVITPFLTDAGATVLVNRGWIVQDPSRQRLPDITVGGARQTIVGRVGSLPVAGLELATAPAPPSWPSVRQFPDLAELSDALEQPLEPSILLLSPDASDGYVRNWRAGGIPASRHLGYAVQWLALLITLWIIALVVSFRKE